MSRKQDFDQFDNLIDELQQDAKRPSAPDAFKSELREQLLSKYEKSTFSLAVLGRWAGTAVALGVLALIVFLSWNSLGQQSAAISAQIGTVNVPGRDEFIVYDQLRLEFPVWVEFDSGWAHLTAESWQSLDGTFFRGELVDANNKQRIFVQGDGQVLWQGTYNSSVKRMETVSLQYFDVYHALAQAEGWAGDATTPPFYDDVGWDGLVQSVLRLDWHCEGGTCIEKYLVEPPLGVNSRGGEYEPYGWSVSLLDTETANGRSLTTYRINYSPNQDGIADSKYRLVTLDSNDHTVVEVADYDGETLLRRLERVSHQIVTSAELPEDQFTRLPAETGVSFVLPEGQTTAEAPLLTAPDGEQEAILAAGTQLSLSGLMNNQPTVTRNGITWQYVSVPDVGQGWVDEASLQWPLTSDGQLVDLDTSRLPTAVPVQTQLIILRNYQTELQALLPQTTGDDLARLQQALSDIAAEIARLEQEEQEAALSSFRDGPLLTRHELSATQLTPGDKLDITLFWDGEPESTTYVAVHLTDASGNLFSQSDQLLTEEMNLTLFIPEGMADGIYEIVVIRYDAATGARQDSLLLQEIGVGTAVDTIERAPNDAWLVSATQHPRTSADAPITLTINVAYQLETEEEVILKPLYAHPDWETASDGRLPIDGLGDEIVLSGKSGTQTIAFVEDPVVIRNIVGTDQPVLVMQLGYFSEDENGSNQLNVISTETMPDFALDLTSTEEITYQIDLSALDPTPTAIVSGTDGNGLTLRSEPNGQDLGTLEEGSVVILREEPLQESDGLFWQAVSTPIGAGWVVADFLSYIDTLTILHVSPPVGAELHNRTTFTITVAYQLTSSEIAYLSSSLLPAFGGAAVLGNDQQTIERGSGELTYSFEFEPLEPNEPSAWILDLRLESPQVNPGEASLATVSPHDNFPSDVYRFEP